MPDNCEMCNALETELWIPVGETMQMCWPCFYILFREQAEQIIEESRQARRRHIEANDGWERCTCDNGYTGADGHTCFRCEGSGWVEAY